MQPARAGAGRPTVAPVKYDGDQKLLAFGGAVSMVWGSVFWTFAGFRFLAQAIRPDGGPSAGPTAFVCLSIAVAGLFFALVAWGLRAKMQRGEVVTQEEVLRMLVVGFVVGVVLGFLIYLALRFKLEDPEFYHLASEPENVPPALR